MCIIVQSETLQLGKVAQGLVSLGRVRLPNINAMLMCYVTYSSTIERYFYRRPDRGAGFRFYCSTRSFDSRIIADGRWRGQG